MKPDTRMSLRTSLDNPALPIIVYLALIGLLSVASGGVAPGTVENNTPEWLTHAWAGSLALGGLLATVAAVTGRTRGESAGLAMVLFGLGLYAWSLVVTQWPVGLAPSSAVLALMACVFIRMRQLRKARKAVRVARRIVRDGDPWTD